MELRTVNVIRYVTPLREGGSLPAIVEADDGFLYVLKFRGAGQGRKALISEIIGGELARSMGLRVPEIVFMNLDDSFAQTEPDEEIQDLLRFSVGLNLGLHYLSGSLTFDPLATEVDALEASLIVLLDSIITNIDRTVKNTNLLYWNREIWLIDHGASLYFHHNWDSWEDHRQRTFPLVKDHVLLSRALALDQAASMIKETVTVENIREIIALVPDDFLADGEERSVYEKVLLARLQNLDALVEEAKKASYGSI
ncbi:HipA family kinase [Portibacter marinus]|uniref:HipA family kinase n=1 Tax=Portibacter marinus TaxID=2898660 RepID=UPI001F2A30C3|nr:HipA family kinase [Portibacter marinus]